MDCSLQEQSPDLKGCHRPATILTTPVQFMTAPLVPQSLRQLILKGRRSILLLNGYLIGCEGPGGLWAPWWTPAVPPLGSGLMVPGCQVHRSCKPMMIRLGWPSSLVVQIPYSPPPGWTHTLVSTSRWTHTAGGPSWGTLRRERRLCALLDAFERRASRVWFPFIKGVQIPLQMCCLHLCTLHFKDAGFGGCEARQPGAVGSRPLPCTAMWQVSEKVRKRTEKGQKEL